MPRLAFVAHEAAHGAAKIRKRIEVLHLLEDASIDDGRKGAELGAVVAREVRDHVVEGLEHPFERGATAKSPVHTARNDEFVPDQPRVEIVEVGVGCDCCLGLHGDSLRHGLIGFEYQ